MARKVTLQLEGFAHESLMRLLGDTQRSPDAVCLTAVLYYLADREAGRAAWRAPRFRPAQERGGGVDVEFDDDTWGALEGEAHHQGVTPEALATHAVLYLVADLESGRLGGRLKEALDDLDGPG